jgi:hypothetical protein
LGALFALISYAHLMKEIEWKRVRPGTGSPYHPASVTNVGDIRAAAHELHAEHLGTRRGKVRAVRLYGHHGDLDVLTFARFGGLERLALSKARRSARSMGNGLCRLRVEWACMGRGGDDYAALMPGSALMV